MGKNTGEMREGDKYKKGRRQARKNFIALFKPV
jgi:hypothetical protein